MLLLGPVTAAEFLGDDKPSPEDTGAAPFLPQGANRAPRALAGAGVLRRLHPPLSQGHSSELPACTVGTDVCCHPEEGRGLYRRARVYGTGDPSPLLGAALALGIHEHAAPTRRPSNRLVCALTASPSSKLFRADSRPQTSQAQLRSPVTGEAPGPLLPQIPTGVPRPPRCSDTRDRGSQPLAATLSPPSAGSARPSRGGTRVPRP